MIHNGIDYPYIDKILLSEEQIAETVKRLADQISADYAKDPDHRLVLLCILKGSVVFMGDLMKTISIPVEIDFMRVSSYVDGTKSSGNINIILDLNRKDLKDSDILIVEDIVDSGNTLKFLVDHIKAKGAKSVKTCAFLDKPSRRKIDINPDYVGKEIPDKFVFGYGLDLFEKYRDLPYVAVVSPEYLATRGL